MQRSKEEREKMRKGAEQMNRDEILESPTWCESMRGQDAKKTEEKVSLIQLLFQEAVLMRRGGALYTNT